MRTRRLLQESQLDAFMAYCQTQGWTPRPTLGTEICRMVHPRRDTMIIHPALQATASDRPPRYPIYDEASRMYDEWQDSMKKESA